MMRFIAALLLCLVATVTNANAKTNVSIASWDHTSTETASGERFDPEARTCAHRTLPFNTWLRVSDIETGRSVLCRVNDRGPFRRHGREVDLTLAGARLLGIVDRGLTRVRIERVPPPAVPPRSLVVASASPDESMKEATQTSSALEAGGISEDASIANAALNLGSDLAGRAATEGHDDNLSRARAYLVLTSTPGRSMAILGVDYAIAQLHPTFAIRAAAAIAEARASGLRGAGIYSSFRPPALGIGGFADKFNSLHAYGLAADFTGIGSAGSKQALEWHRIATKHKLYNPYGPRNYAEFNHYQATRETIIIRGNPLRRTITARGAIDLPRMWRVGAAIIDQGIDRSHRLAYHRRVRMAHR